jgi:hypothetical protein
MVCFQLPFIRDLVESGSSGFLPVNNMIADVENGAPLASFLPDTPRSTAGSRRLRGRARLL